VKRVGSAFAVAVLALGVVLVTLLAGLAVPPSPTSTVLTIPGSATVGSAHAASPLLGGSSGAPTPSGGSAPTVPANHPSGTDPPASASALASPHPATSGWHTSNFFEDVRVNFYETGLPLGFQEVPYVNTLPSSVLGFYVNITAAAPLLFANMTIWGNQWPGTNTSATINGFSPTAPALRPMVINSTDPAEASFHFDNYRFFWPGSTVSFNITVVGQNSTPSLVKSASNVSVVENYPGGFSDAATWMFTVASPWESPTFANDIQIVTTPNVLGPVVYAPNPRQSLEVTIESVPVNGVATPIPAATLDLQVNLNGTASAAAIPFGPVNHAVMSLTSPIGPYGGATVSFSVSAWLPWEGGRVDLINSSVVNFTWSPNGGWWHPLAGLLGNLELVTSPTLTPSSGTLPGNALTLATDQPVTVTIHEPIENVTIASTQVIYTFTDGGASRVGTIPMTAVSANTSSLTIPGLPPYGALTFSITAKDIYGNPISSGNFSYSEAGPTNPSLPAGQGLLFVEVLDLSTGGLVPSFAFSVGNATWSVNGTANTLGFATPSLPGSTVPVRLAFGSYLVSVNAFGSEKTAAIELSPSSPTPTVVFIGESHPLPIATTNTLSAESIAAIAGLVAASVVTLPLVLWFEERRAKAEEEQRRIIF